MDYIHLRGIDAIQGLQHAFKDQSELMLFMSHLGDPRNAFLVYFPLSYFIHHSIGKRVLWVAAISEWLNSVFKCLLHGDRPYWWIKESELYNHVTRPEVQQFRLTCETGPGSPSGHAMVTSSVLYIMVSDFLYYGKVKRLSVRVASWTTFGAVMLAVNASRCFIATHFPHQVLAGVTVGIFIGHMFKNFSTAALTLKHHLMAGVAIVATTVLTYVVIFAMGMDPLWSVTQAKKWCAEPSWIHLDTIMFYSIVRDSASLIGLGLSLFLIPKLDDSDPSMANRLVHIVVSLVIGRLSDIYKLPRNPQSLFYILAFLKFTALIIFFVNIVPRINIFPSKQHEKES